MIRKNLCPSCGKQLRWEPPTFDRPSRWVCKHCNYKRWDGAEIMDDLISRAAAIHICRAYIYPDTNPNHYDMNGKIDYGQWMHNNGEACAAVNIQMHIEELPAVDAALVVHGKWRDTGSGQECSVCKEIQYGYDSGRFYCSNCGAKMDR